MIRGHDSTEPRLPQEPAESSDADLREAFRRFAPDAEPIDVDALLLRAALRRSPRRRFEVAVAAVAAAVLLAACGVGAVAAARHEARREMARREEAIVSELRALHHQLAGDLAEALRDTRVALVEAQEDRAKGLANLLRNDYMGRLARLEIEIERVDRSLRRTRLGTSDAGRWPLVPASTGHSTEER